MDQSKINEIAKADRITLEKLILQKLDKLKNQLIASAYDIGDMDVYEERKKMNLKYSPNAFDYSKYESTIMNFENSNKSIYNTMNSVVTIPDYVPYYKDWDIRKAIGAMRNPNLVHPKSTGYCARSVRSFIEAGGILTNGRPTAAYRYAAYLPTIGFRHVARLIGRDEQSAFSPQPGDISVMAHGKYGHICMWSGSSWVSDFVQRNMWPYAGNGVCDIFRFTPA